MARVRELTSKPFGVDLLTAMPGQVEAGIDDVIDGGARIFVAGLGVPREAIDALHDANVLVGSMCGKVRHAVGAVASGCDFVVAQGTEAGGHTGHGGDDGARPAGRRRRRRAGAGRRRRRPVRRPRPGRRADARRRRRRGSAPASSPRPRRGPSTATRRRCWRLPEDGTVISRAYTGKTCRVVRNDWTQHFEEHPEELQPFPAQVFAASRAGANHLGAPDGTDRRRGPRVLAGRPGRRRHRRARPRRRARRPDGRRGRARASPRRVVGTLADDAVTTTSLRAPDRRASGTTTSCRRCASTSRIPNVSEAFDADWEANGHMETAVDADPRLVRRRDRSTGSPSTSHRLPGPHAADRLRGPGNGRRRRRPHRAALRAPRQAAGDDRLARRPRAVDAGHRGRPALRPRRRRRRLRRLRRPPRHRGGPGRRHSARPLRRAHRGQRGERQPRPAGLRRRARRPPRLARARRLPRLRLPRHRAPVGDDVAARPRQRAPHRRGADRRRALRPGQRRRAVELPPAAPAARPRRGQRDRRGAAARAARRAPGRPGGRGAPDGGRDPARRPTSSASPAPPSR